jgi:hypothetical protein
MITTKTTAERIVDTLSQHKDGLTSEDRRALDISAKRIINDDYDTVKWIFADESVITSVCGIWDVGYRHCSCWQSAGHVEE